MSKINKVIVVTGFGPFEGHEVNASWEAVKLLPAKLVVRNIEFKIYRVLIPVEYLEIDKMVEKIWNLCPFLVIHCGVRGETSHIYLEKFGTIQEFPYPDFKEQFLEGGKIILRNLEYVEDCQVQSGLDLEEIVEKISEAYGCFGRNPDGSIDYKDEDTVALISSDAGNYVCNYIYLKSLDKDKERCLFIHVPPVDDPFDSTDVARIIWFITRQCAMQLLK